ncbi:MAG: bifunctional oligoribonuclease/PAP phosphatase NrnA [bacterium]|nr:bifunctional oligoribonuclease/PAP phosphatase NrnA [bacterium]
MAAQRVNPKEIAKLLEEAKSVAIFGHILPDGDCYGGVFALKIALEGIGKDVFSYISDVVPEYLTFLEDYESLKSQKEFCSADLALVLDSSDLKRTENSDFLYEYKKTGAKICLVDHHTTGDLIDFVDYAWQDTAKSSTSEMVLDVLKEMNLKIKKEAATLLLTGIETDTSSFQNQNTTVEALEASAFLMSKGARLARIVNNTFHAKDMDTIKLYGLVLERLVYNEKYGTIVGYLTQKDARDLGIEGDISTGVANYLNTIEDAKMIVFITEVEEGVLKVSLRTRDEGVDVSTLAKAFGGGGHVKASGFTVRGKVTNIDGKIKITC